MAPVCADAQWWRSAPVDFESCADQAEKAATKEEKTAKLADCNAKFAGRRKPGGGYTYYDFMQDRTFDIAGPNPTPEEQKKIDEQYTAYLERERRNHAAAMLAAKQQQEQEQDRASPGKPQPSQGVARGHRDREGKRHCQDGDPDAGAERRERIAAPRPPKPTSIMAHAAGSGTAL